MSGEIVVLIIILVIITSMIFALSITAFHLIKKSEKALVDLGKRDSEIIQEHHKKIEDKKKHKTKNVVFGVLHGFVYAFSALMLVGVVFATVTHVNNNMIFIGNTSSLVIASNSMSGIGDKENDLYHQKAENGGHITDEMLKEEFKRGDILVIKSLPSEDEIISRDEYGNYYYVDNGVNFTHSIASDYLNKVFAFKYQDMIVVHRLVKIDVYTNSQGEEQFSYMMQGDLYPSQYQLVTYNSLRGVYNGTNKVQFMGYFILFLSSVFGIYSLAGCLGMITISTIYSNKIQKIYNERLTVILPQEEKEKEDVAQES